jgi:steroid delta-isomerase-like uncharacterized protein
MATDIKNGHGERVVRLRWAPALERTIEMSDNTATARALYEAWEKRDFDALAETLADGVSFNDATSGRVIEGKADVKDFYASWAVACPDSVAGATVVAASDDTVAIEGVWAGTNTGPFGPLPATGRSVSMPWANVLHFDPDGRIIGGAAYANLLPVMIQLGHMQPPAEG